jgi:hypothetical protein
MFPNAMDTIAKLDAYLVRPLIQGIATMHEQALPVVASALEKCTWADAVKELKRMDDNDLKQNVIP